MRIISVLIICLSLVGTAQAQKAPALEITEAWVPEAPPVAKVMAGYMKIRNPGKKIVTIQSVSSPDFKSVEMHETKDEKGVMKMIKQDYLAIPAGKSRHFERGGLHLMLFKPKHPMKVGDTVTLKLKTDAGLISVKAMVKAAELEDHSHHQH